MISFKGDILFLINFSTSVWMQLIYCYQESIINKISRLLADSNRKKFSFGVFKNLEN